MSNSNAVAKDTIWQRLNAQTGPLLGASAFACVLSGLTLWLSGGAAGAWVSLIAFAILLLGLVYLPIKSTPVFVPMLLALGGLALAALGGGIAGLALSACLWPLLAQMSQSNRQANRGQLILGLAASIASLLGVAWISLTIGQVPLNAADPAQTGILAFGICGALAVSSYVMWGRSSRDSAVASLSDPQANLLIHERDVALADAKAARDQSRDRAQFMAEMSHEIRTPLNAILGFADTMQAQVFGPIPASYADYPGLIHKSGSHLLDLVSDLLDLSKVEAGRYDLALKPLRLDELVLEGVQLSGGNARLSGVQIRHEASGPILVQGDMRAVRQIIFNLMSNAIKFTPQGGRIWVGVRVDPALQTANLIVEDSGIGMSEADLARVGQPWNQVSEDQTGDAKRVRGSGLGLALVKQLTHLQGGQFGLASALGVGTRATITLPLATDPTTPPV